MFRKYEKIYRLGSEETDGILSAPVHVQEKIDGANTSIYCDGLCDGLGTLFCGSRTRQLDDDDFNGFVPYVQSHEGIKQLFAEHPTWRLYGEWLVRHTIRYKETAYKQWYMYDIWDGEKYLTTPEVNKIAGQYGINTPTYHGEMLVTDISQLTDLVGRSSLGDRGEGIVLKRPDFKNAFGDTVYAKLVSDAFKEDNAVVFGGNNKTSPTYWETWVVNKFMSLARVQKVLNKLQPEINERLGMKHIPRVCMSVLHDLITEEAWTIAQDVPAIDFRALKRIAFKKCKQVYTDILNDSISVADLHGKEKQT